MTVLVEVEGLCARPAATGGNDIVRGVSLALMTGQAIGLLGPSGSGKSTFARALLGLEEVTAGTVRFRGKVVDVARRAAWQPLRAAVHLCWQDASSAFDPSRAIATAIAEARALARRPTLNCTQLHDLLARVGLEPEHASRRPGELSGGQAQRAALARALAAEPELIIADEITSALDHDLAFALIDDILRPLVDRGVGLLVITHDVTLIVDLVDELAIMDAGTIVERGPTRDVLRSPRSPVARALVSAVRLAR